MRHRRGAYRTILTHFSQRYPKAPVFDDHYTERTAVRSDLMRVDMKSLPRLPSLLPAARALPGRSRRGRGGGGGGGGRRRRRRRRGRKEGGGSMRGDEIFPGTTTPPRGASIFVEPNNGEMKRARRPSYHTLCGASGSLARRVTLGVTFGTARRVDSPRAQMRKVWGFFLTVTSERSIAPSLAAVMKSLACKPFTARDHSSMRTPGPSM